MRVYRRSTKLASSCLLSVAFGACGGTTNASGDAASGAVGCRYAGSIYAVDALFPAEDGCNTCRCGEDLVVSCGHVPCHVCSDLEAKHAAELALAKTCDPAEANPCATPVRSDLSCGCTTLATSELTMETDAFFVYADLGCRGIEPCGTCPTPVGAECTPAGQCVDVK